MAGRGARISAERGGKRGRADFWLGLHTLSFLGSGGQTLDDMYKYLPSDDRLSMARRTLEWRHVAPTAPDTLCGCPALKRYIQR